MDCRWVLKCMGRRLKLAIVRLHAYGDERTRFGMLVYMERE